MDSSMVERYTINVEEEVHHFLKNDERNKAGLFTGKGVRPFKWPETCSNSVNTQQVSLKIVTVCFTYSMVNY
jgi:hypothetical protein